MLEASGPVVQMLTFFFVFKMQMGSTISDSMHQEPIARGKTIILIEEEADKFENKIQTLVQEVESQRNEIEYLKEENERLQTYRVIYEKFSPRIEAVFEAVDHAARGSGTMSV